MKKNPMFSDMEMLENNQLKQTIIDNLLNEKQDWAFVVKSYAYLEAIIWQYLNRWLETSDKDKIKINSDEVRAIRNSWCFGKKIDVIRNNTLLPEKYINFLSNYSNLRGSLVHDIKTINFKFAEKFNDEMTNELDAVVSDIINIIPDRDKDIAKNTDIYICIVSVIVKIFYLLNYNEEVNPAFGGATMPSLTVEGSAH